MARLDWQRRQQQRRPDLAAYAQEYVDRTPDLRGGPFASRMSAIGVGVEAANRFWRASRFPWVVRECLEFGAGRMERRLEKHGTHLDRERARSIGEWLTTDDLRSLPLFAHVTKYNRATLPDGMLLSFADEIVSVACDLKQEERERERAKALWGHRHAEGLARVRSRLRRALVAEQFSEFDHEFTGLLSIFATPLEQTAERCGHRWFKDDDDFYPVTAAAWERDADRAAMLASVEATIKESGRGRPQATGADLETVCRRVYLAVSGRRRIRYTKSEPSGGEYGRFLACAFHAIGRPEPPQRLFAKPT